MELCTYVKKDSEYKDINHSGIKTYLQVEMQFGTFPMFPQLSLSSNKAE